MRTQLHSVTHWTPRLLLPCAATSHWYRTPCGQSSESHSNETLPVVDFSAVLELVRVIVSEAV